jgi:hypothetical protein
MDMMVDKMVEEKLTPEKSPAIVQIIVTMDEKGQLHYEKQINFPSSVVAALILLDLEKFVNDLKLVILNASTQAYQAAQPTKEEKHGENYL